MFRVSEPPMRIGVPPRQLFSPHNHPLLFVIPTEGEESAVRHSGAPHLPFAATLFSTPPQSRHPESL